MSRRDPAQDVLPGLVRAAIGGVYEVEVHQAGGVGAEAAEPAGPEGRPAAVEASLRGRLKQQQRTGDAVVVGDRVDVRRHEDGSHTIEAVHERTSQLARLAPGSRKSAGGAGAGGARRKGGAPTGARARVVVANVDRMFVVFAAAHPEPRLRLVDRFLVQAEAADVDATIVVNKVDLARPEQLSPFATYEAAGYPVLRTSVKSGAGIDALHDALRGGISVLVGPSGAGKSSLLNAIQPGLRLATGEVSEAVGKGRHTTVSARLIPLDGGGYVADTPGLRELGLWDVEPDTLDLCFPEFHPFLDDCRFGRSCTHTHEPGCGVREAVEAGAVAAERYSSYVALLGGE